jgi:hypothetical protein
MKEFAGFAASLAGCAYIVPPSPNQPTIALPNANC